jgi:hypothetical protein
MNTISQIKTEMLQARKAWNTAWQTAYQLRAPNAPAFRKSYEKYVEAQKASDAAWCVYKACKTKFDNANVV